MARKIIIIDDDDIAGDLSRTLLQDAGFEVELLMESRHALERIRQSKPDLIVLDILMPGLDGLSLCRQIKSAAGLSSIKIAVVSAKAFPADKIKAKEAGADIFIAKPYDIETFSDQIARLLAPQEEIRLTPARPLTDSANPIFRVSLWGSRSAGSDKHGPSRYGLKTPCVQVDVAGRVLLFDAGTGALAAGHAIAASADRKEIWIFLSHFHSSHLSGLSGFLPLSWPDCTVHFCAAAEAGKNLSELLHPTLEARLPEAGKIRAKLDLYELRSERYEIFSGVVMTAFYANHPGTTLGFILESGGRKMAYCPDDEIYGSRTHALRDHDEKLSQLYSGLDLVIHNGRYTVEDYPHFEDQGHSSFLNTVYLAGQCGVKRLILFHQDARYSDAELDRMGAVASKRAQDRGYPTQVIVAQEDLRVAI